jgi:uncharacterized protein (TIGR02246 family)
MSTTQDEAEIKAVLARLYQAWDASDADAFVADYTEDATAILPGSARMSRAEIRDSMAAGFSTFLKGTTTIDSIQSIRFLGDRAAVVISQTGVLFPGESEVPADRISNATWVLEKQPNEVWNLAAYHNSPAVVK